MGFYERCASPSRTCHAEPATGSLSPADDRGCHLDRKTDDLIRDAGFEISTVETGYMTGPKPWTFMHHGSATN